MQDQQILDQVKSLVDREHALRERASRGELDPDEEQRQLQALEEALDRCWDLLRRRRAAREDAHTDPDAAAERSTGTVEGYLQ